MFVRRKLEPAPVSRLDDEWSPVYGRKVAAACVAAGVAGIGIVGYVVPRYAHSLDVRDSKQVLVDNADCLAAESKIFANGKSATIRFGELTVGQAATLESCGIDRRHGPQEIGLDALVKDVIPSPATLQSEMHDARAVIG